MNRCPNCGLTKPLSEFHVDRSKASGYKSWCKTCANGQARGGYAGRKGAPVRPYGVFTPQELVEHRRQSSRKKTRKRHGGSDEWARMYSEQQGLCYLCLRPLPEDRAKVHVDHDHSCCPPDSKGRTTRSCRYCRRGLAHEHCNQVWGLVREDPELLRTMASQGERVAAETRARIAAKSWEPLLLL